MHNALDDIAIINLVLQGQHTAYAVLITRYQQYVYTLAMRHVNNRELAEELSQDVFLKAYRFLADYKGTGKFSTWLYTIVHTTCLSHLRKNNDTAILLTEDQILSLPNQQSADPIDRMEQQTQKQLVEIAIKQLPKIDAQIITLFYLAEQSVEEIGIILGLTASNVKVRLYRARQKLKEIMEQKCMHELSEGYKLTTDNH
ncbi:MAG: RNA polymerase sigma factor [Flavipsychrobacter sp.]|nr:RNA polymerase sigma factor [Flavipsychrobacter sp.]